MGGKVHVAIGERQSVAQIGRAGTILWFRNLNALSQVLSDENRRLIGLIEQHRPKSLPELAALSGRETSNLSRTLRMLSRYGILELRRGKRRAIAPIVRVRAIQLDLTLV